MAAKERSILSDLHIVEIASDIAAAACGRQFARWGAHVVKISTTNTPRHPLVRRQGKTISLLSDSLDTGKQLLDEARLTGALIRAADILITDLPLDSLPQVRKWPIVIDISPYGRSGPYCDYVATPFTVEAMSSFMSVQGEADREPLRMPAHIMARACGVSAFNAALAAWYRFCASGIREHIEVSCMEVLCTIVPTLRTQLGDPEQRSGGPGKGVLGVRLYKFGDGYLSFNFALRPALDSLLDIIGLDESAIPEHLRSFKDRQNYPVLKEFVESLPSPFSAADLFTIISEPPHTSAVGKVMSPLETLSDPQLEALGYWQSQRHPELGDVLRSGPPARLSRTPAVPPQPAAGFKRWRRRRAVVRPGERRLTQPLAGVNVLDLTQAWIGPYATQLLRDLGAEVIKVESLHKPDVWRKSPAVMPKIANPDAKSVNTNPNFNSVNRGKRSLTLDLSTREGRELFLNLVTETDVVMENYTPRVMANFGLAYEDLVKVKPDLIMTSFCAYGQNGPYAAYRGNGTTIEAVSGWDSLFGYPEGPPLVMGFYQADAITGLQMAATTLLALLHRQCTGEGQYVKGSMFEAAVDYIEEMALLGQFTDELPVRGNRSPDIAPQGVYPCRGDDAWVAIAVESDDAWRALAGLGEINLGKWSNWDLAARHARHDEIDDHLAAWTRGHSALEVTARLQQLGIASAPVQKTDEILSDPHLAARNWWHVLTHPDLGTHKYAGFPWRFSRSRLACDEASPRLGQHSREIFRQRLQLDDAEVDRLFEAGVSGEDF